MSTHATLSAPLVLAMVAGKPLTEIPADLFIPPDALEILLDSFSGPLDLLLYLIRRQNIDILNIPIALISRQYLQYIQILEQHRLELAADYLVMAALLAEIKSRLLLPPVVGIAEDIEEDPRLVLVRKLQVYEQFKNASLNIDALPRCERDVFRVALTREALLPHTRKYSDVDLISLVDAMNDLLKRQRHFMHHHIAKESLSIRERMTQVLEKLRHSTTVAFPTLFYYKEGRMGLAVTLLAVLELARLSLLLISQAAAFSSIHIQAIEHGKE